MLVRDDGHWKEPVAAQHRGRGFGLMRTLMGEVVVDQAPGGTVVRLTRRIQLATSVGEAAGPRRRRRASEGCEVEVATASPACAASSTSRSVDDVEPGLREAAEGKREFTVDLTAVDYLDSAGARMLLELSEPRSAGLIVVAPPGDRAAPRRSSCSGLMDLLDVRG